MIDFIVIPEGLDRANPGKDPNPSWIYETVLRRVVELVSKDDRIFLAPANSFGQPLREHEAAARMLAQLLAKANKPSVQVLAPSVSNHRYIDTRGNAVLLKCWLDKNEISLQDDLTLVAYSPHLERTRICFRQTGFRFTREVRVVRGGIKPRPIVSRLFYYRYPVLHYLYETILIPLTWMKLR